MKRREMSRYCFTNFIQWRQNNVSERTFVLFVSFIVGLLTSFATVLLKNIIHFIQHFLTNTLNLWSLDYLYLVYPAIGILLSGLFVRYILKDDISHGVTKILFAISQRKSRIKPHNTWSSVVASAMTIGFGGSVGAESPIVLTGAAIGSNLGRMFKLEQHNLMLLVGCGSAGAIAGIFKAPIAGLVFTIEVLMLDLTLTSVLPLLISCVTAATVSYIFTGTHAMFHFIQNEVFTLNKIPNVLMLGIFCGFISLYFTKAMDWFENKFRNLRSYGRKFSLGASILSVLIFLFPPLYGEGYDTIEKLLRGDSASLMNGSLFNSLSTHYWGIIIFLSLVIVLKVFAATATNGGGGCGGIFAPTLFIGCIAGFVFSYLSNSLFMGVHVSERNFALMGMGGLMSGVMHAPLTGVFLIAELTGGYSLFLPLMIVSLSSYITIVSFEPHSIYSMRLAKRGELLTHHKDKAVLTLLNIKSLIETDFIVLNPKMTLAEVVKNAVAKSPRNVFPVVNKAGKLRGIVLLDNIRNIMFRPELYERFKVEDFMVSAPFILNVNMSMEKIMTVFDDTKAWNLPVVSESGVYIGFVSKSKIFNAYREVLVDNFSEEE